MIPRFFSPGRNLLSSFRLQICNETHIPGLRSVLRSASSTAFQGSDPQMSVVNAVKCNCNVVVNAVAGSGKTATIQLIAQALPPKVIRVLTYNRRLKDDTAERLRSLPNISVSTFHGLVEHSYKHQCRDDTQLQEFLKSRRTARQRTEIAPFDILIIDEAQDVDPRLYELILRVCMDNNRATQLLALGDERQAIYQFKESDPRYLSLAPNVFSSINASPWKTIKLTKSHRITSQTAEFVNEFSQEVHIQGYRDGPAPIRLSIDWKWRPSRGDETTDCLMGQVQKYGSRTMVASLSLRDGCRGRFSPVRLFENFLVGNGIRTYVAPMDERELHHEALQGKVVISTYHQAKGREADLVTVFTPRSRMSSYMPGLSDFNSLYVGLTRGKVQLIIIEYGGPARKKNRIVDGERHPKIQYPKRKVSVTDFIRHLHFEDIDKALEKIKITTAQHALPPEMNQVMMRIPSLWVTEEISDLTGTAIHAHLELTFCNSLRVLNKKDSHMPMDARQLLIQVNSADARNSYKGRYTQMMKEKTGHIWLTDKHLKQSEDGFRKVIGGGTTCLQFEKQVERSIGDLVGAEKDQTIRLTGALDVHYLTSSATSVCVELKFTNDLSQAHKLHMAIYGWMLNGSVEALKLFNIKTDELLEMKLPPDDVMTNIIRELCRKKYEPKAEATDEEFLKMNQEIREYVQ